MKLPFLEESHWPTSRESKTRHVNGDGDDTTLLHEALLDEFLRAYEARDAKALRHAFQALIRMIKLKEIE